MVKQSHRYILVITNLNFRDRRVASGRCREGPNTFSLSLAQPAQPAQPLRPIWGKGGSDQHAQWQTSLWFFRRFPHYPLALCRNGAVIHSDTDPKPPTMVMPEPARASVLPPWLHTRAQRQTLFPSQECI